MTAEIYDYSIICNWYCILIYGCVTWHVASLYSLQRSGVKLCAALVTSYWTQSATFTPHLFVLSFVQVVG